MMMKSNSQKKPLIKKTDKYEGIYDFKYFHSLFKNKYDAKQLGEKGRGKKKVSLSLYKSILMEYLDIYFKEIYFLDGPSYFLYTGALQKVKYRPRIIINKGIKKLIGTSIGFLWFERPSELFWVCCKLEKLAGSTNRIPKIEKIYKNNFDINLIVNFEDAVKEQHSNNNTFIL